jgi:catechol 2,3-dioxygenase-like lactoylglutathione lyase family enzyme
MSSPAPLPPGLDHVAIAVNDLEAAIHLYRDVLGLPLAELEEVASGRWSPFGSQGRIELLCPASPDSA